MNPESLKRFEQGVIMAGIEQQVEANLDADQVRRLILGLDERQADLDFTVRLVSELAESVAEEVAADESEPPSRLLEYREHGISKYLHPSAIVQALATEPPTRIIEIMGRALKQARLMREGIEKADGTPCEHDGCGCSDAKIHLDLVSRELHREEEPAVSIKAKIHECWCGHGPLKHTRDQGCTAQVHVDEDYATETCECVAYNTTDWTTPRGIQRLEKMVADAVEENARCSVCGHAERNHNSGPGVLPCLPGLGHLVCHACNINHKEG